MKPTQEQQDIIDAVGQYPMVAGNAMAGSGKTSLSIAVVDHYKPKKAFYTAFNKSIVVEAQEKFTSNVECKTKHAFALSHVRPKNKIEDFTYLCIREDISYPSKRIIMDAMDDFFRSSSIDIDEYMHEAIEDKDLADIAVKYIQQMIEDIIPPTFNFLLKYLHLMLHQNLITIKYDLMILDECQDTTEVFFEIFTLIECPKKLIIGDVNQNIYGFMNTINAFDLIEDTPIFPLTKSFRCSEAIAARVQEYGKLHLNKDFTYVGTDSDKTDGSIAYIGRTNGSILMRLQSIIEEGQSFSLTRPVKEIFALPMALANVSAGRTVFHKKYKYLEKEYRNYSLSGMRSFYAYLMRYVEDEELHSCIAFMNMLREKKINIFQLKKDAENAVLNPKVWIVTAHSFKGREVDTVVIEDSLNRSVNKIIEQGGPENAQDREELNLGYVACTRARHNLLNCDFMPEPG